MSEASSLERYIYILYSINKHVEAKTEVLSYEMPQRDHTRHERAHALQHWCRHHTGRRMGLYYDARGREDAKPHTRSSNTTHTPTKKLTQQQQQHYHHHQKITHRAVRPREVVVHVGQVGRVRPEQVVQLAVPVVLLHRTHRPLFARGRPIRQRGVLSVPRGEQAVEGLEVFRVVSDARVVRVPRLVEVRGAQSLQVPKSVNSYKQK